MNQTPIELGPFIAGEIPAPLSYSFTNADNEPLFIDSFVTKYQYKRLDGPGPVTVNATVDANTTTHIWGENEIAEPGIYEAVFWVSDQATRFASIPFIYRVKPAPGDVPDFV